MSSIYPKDFEDYYLQLELSSFNKISSESFYKETVYRDWLIDKQSTEEFEKWWSATYENKLGSTIIELSFKEVAKAAWDEQQSTVKELIEQVNSLHNNLAQLD